MVVATATATDEFAKGTTAVLAATAEVVSAATKALTVTVEVEVYRGLRPDQGDGGTGYGNTTMAAMAELAPPATTALSAAAEVAKGSSRQARSRWRLLP